MNLVYFYDISTNFTSVEVRPIEQSNHYKDIIKFVVMDNTVGRTSTEVKYKKMS